MTYTLIKDPELAEQLSSSTQKPTRLNNEYLFTGLIEGGEHLTREEALKWKQDHAPETSEETL